MSNNNINDSNSYKLFDLNKWDKSHLPELRKNSILKEQIMEKLSKVFSESHYNNLNFKFTLSRNMNRLKRMNKNENIQNFYKNIEQENSNVLAQNINMMKKRFNFNIFKSPTRLTIKNVKFLSSSGKKVKKKISKKSLSSKNIIPNENIKKKVQ